jgi:hypothetical protein
VKILRTIGLAAAVAGTVAFGGSPAGAAGAGAFAGDASIDCFGCGTSDCSASLTVGGVVGTAPAVGAAATTSCTANEPADVTCVVSGSASGRVEGSVNVDFNWTRVGAAAVITTSGDINGAGAAVFVVTSPVGNPCGQAVAAKVVGALAGA